MTNVSVVLPVYNVERYVAASIQSVLAQTYADFELVIVDDGSTDGSLHLCQQFTDPRIRIIQQKNRGLAGARNTGIRHATGEYIALLDSDDLFAPEKLQRHVEHLDRSPKVGISFSRSAFIDDDSQPLGYYQMPKLKEITTPDILCRNPIGNGSAPVIRRQVFQEIGIQKDLYGVVEDFFFDDSFRQSEDIECWLRMAIQTSWLFEGIPEPLTLYRVNGGGLSASIPKQLASWERVIEKIKTYDPKLLQEWGSLARAYQLRYLARRAWQLRDKQLAIKLIHEALITDGRMLMKEPQRTLMTIGAIYLLALLPQKAYGYIQAFAFQTAFRQQQRNVGYASSPSMSSLK
jgi:glycosyltransferase involved in cell wall biosynthesis